MMNAKKKNSKEMKLNYKDCWLDKCYSKVFLFFFKSSSLMKCWMDGYTGGGVLFALFQSHSKVPSWTNSYDIVSIKQHAFEF